MKRYYDISFKTKKTFNVFISGFSKIYRWIFNNVIKTEFLLAPILPRLKTKISIFYNIVMSAIIKENIPRLKEKYFVNNKIFLLNTIKIRECFRTVLSHISKVKLNIYILRIKDRIRQIIITNIKTGFKTSFSLMVFYKLKEWDFKIPDNPVSSPRYVFSELDDKTLLDMDIKS